MKLKEVFRIKEDEPYSTQHQDLMDYNEFKQKYPEADRALDDPLEYYNHNYLNNKHMISGEDFEYEDADGELRAFFNPTGQTSQVMSQHNDIDTDDWGFDWDESKKEWIGSEGDWNNLR